MNVRSPTIEIVRSKNLLRDCYEGRGCIRTGAVDSTTGRNGGLDLRLVVGDSIERREVVAALKTLKLRHGKVYRKQKNRRQWVIPMYSRVDVIEFFRAVKPKRYTAIIRKIKDSARRRPIKTKLSR